MTTKKLTKLLALYLPYILLGLVATNLGEVWRLAEGKELGDKIMAMMGTFPVAFANPLPSLHPLDLLIGFSCGAGLRLAVYLRSKNAKKYRHGMEYGSARWGNAKDIEPFMSPKFADNIILTKTERLMMSNCPPDPKNARNKNVLVVGGSGSGKTRFWLKPNLLQCHSSYVVTDPKGTIVLECGQAMLKNGYKVKILNTINFKKSMHYNPFSYVHSEKDILKLVTTLMTNTKGEGSGGDPFWEKSERLLLTALIAYLHVANEPKVSFRNGQFIVTDGQHTIEGRILRNGGKDLPILCKVYTGMTVEQEALLFAEQNGFSAPLTAGIKLRAKVVGGDAISKAFLAATNRVGLSLNYDSQQLTDYRIGCVGTALKLYNQMGEKIYCEALRLIVAAWGGKPDSFRASVLRGMMHFVELYHGEFSEERLVRALRSIHPVDIYRIGQDDPAKLRGWKKYVFPIYTAYNGKCRKDALPMKF